MDEYFFVVYENRRKGNSDNSIKIANAIICGIHPLLWIAVTNKWYREHYVTYLHFWEKVPADVAKKAIEINYVNFEDYREKYS